MVNSPSTEIAIVVANDVALEVFVAATDEVGGAAPEARLLELLLDDVASPKVNDGEELDWP